MKIFDFHVHAFPNFLAERAIKTIAKNSGEVKPFCDGTIKDLYRVMREAKVGGALVANIATKPTQFASILEWSLEIRNEHIVPFASVHPDNQKAPDDLSKISAEGIRGIKIHPFYQNCACDDARWFKIYEACVASNLVILFHAGYDIAFGNSDLAHPYRFLKIRKLFPKLKIVLAHFGAWRYYDNALLELCQKDFYFDTSCSVGYCPKDIAQKIIKKHGAEKILFASDCPWGEPKAHVAFINAITSSDAERERIFYRNAEELLGITVPKTPPAD